MKIRIRVTEPKTIVNVEREIGGITRKIRYLVNIITDESTVPRAFFLGAVEDDGTGLIQLSPRRGSEKESLNDLQLGFEIDMTDRSSLSVELVREMLKAKAARII